jgi:hypothetical protein
MQDLLVSSALIWILGRVLKKKADMPPPPVDRMYTNDQLPQRNGNTPQGGGPSQGPESGNRNPYRGGYM